MISPSNASRWILDPRSSPTSTLALLQEEILDDFLEQRAEENRAKVINGGLFIEHGAEGEREGTMDHEDRKCEGEEKKVDWRSRRRVVRAPTAPARVAQDLDAGDFTNTPSRARSASASTTTAVLYENTAEICGDDVSPDYGWVFPKVRPRGRGNRHGDQQARHQGVPGRHPRQGR